MSLLYLEYFAVNARTRIMMYQSLALILVFSTCGAFAQFKCENHTLPDGTYCPDDGQIDHVRFFFFNLKNNFFFKKIIHNAIITDLCWSWTLLQILGLLQWLHDSHAMSARLSLWHSTWMVGLKHERFATTLFGSNWDHLRFFYICNIYDIFVHIFRCDEPHKVTCGDRDPDDRPCKVKKYFVNVWKKN